MWLLFIIWEIVVLYQKVLLRRYLFLWGHELPKGWTIRKLIRGDGCRTKKIFAQGKIK